jgi:hypothetical protein
VTASLRATAALVLGMLGATSVARAELRYAAPAEICPDESAFRDLVTSRVARDVFADPSAPSIDVSIVANGEELSGTLVATGDGHELGRRTLVAPAAECTELAESLALALAVLVAEHRPAEPEPTAPEPARCEPSAPPPEPVAPPPEPSGPEPVFTAALTAGAGAIPGVAAGGALAAAIAFGDLVAGIEARGAGAIGGRASNGLEPIEAGLVTGAPFACFRRGLAIACGTARFGAVLATSPDLPQPSAGAGFFGSIALSAGLVVPLGGALALDARVELEIPWTVVELEIDRDDVWTSSPLAGGLQVGLSISP